MAEIGKMRCEGMHTFILTSVEEAELRSIPAKECGWQEGHRSSASGTAEEGALERYYWREEKGENVP